MTDSETIGWAGAIVGTIAGIAGGIIGSYFSIKNTNGPKERQFAIYGTIGMVFFVALFLAILFLTPLEYRWLIWLPYIFLLFAIIRKWNARQMTIRATEAEKKEI